MTSSLLRHADATLTSSGCNRHESTIERYFRSLEQLDITSCAHTPARRTTTTTTSTTDDVVATGDVTDDDVSRSAEAVKQLFRARVAAMRRSLLESNDHVTSDSDLDLVDPGVGRGHVEVTGSRRQQQREQALRRSELKIDLDLRDSLPTCDDVTAALRHADVSDSLTFDYIAANDTRHCVGTVRHCVDTRPSVASDRAAQDAAPSALALRPSRGRLWPLIARRWTLRPRRSLHGGTVSTRCACPMISERSCDWTCVVAAANRRRLTTTVFRRQHQLPQPMTKMKMMMMMMTERVVQLRSQRPVTARARSRRRSNSGRMGTLQ